MGTPRPIASLSPGLLARKGQARPAMRPHGFAAPAGASEPDDLGWNDLGEPPPVLVEREALAREVETMPAIPIATAMRIGRESAGQTRKGKAAFTLRLDAERHLRLRLASAVAHQSAQALVVRALDHLLTTMPEVEVLAARLPVERMT